jgi:hypothetical protein
MYHTSARLHDRCPLKKLMAAAIVQWPKVVRQSEQESLARMIPQPPASLGDFRP